MIRLSKLTDYGIVMLTHFAQRPVGALLTARGLSESTEIPLPTASKILKMLGRKDLLASTRGVNGGYCLTRHPDTISVAEIVDALEGPIALTTCSDPEAVCDQEQDCSARGPWLEINVAVMKALEDVSLSEFCKPKSPRLVQIGAGLAEGRLPDIANQDTTAEGS